MKNRLQRFIAIAIAGSAFGTVQAAPFEEAVSTTILTNPEVLAKWHQFRASVHERNISWGRYLPTLDVLYGTAYAHKDSPLFTNPSGERQYNFQTTRATLKQNLYEGFATQNDTKRLEHASMVRFHEMLDLSESAAFEATKAYIDVWRFRQLQAFAEESYATHRVIYDKINLRAQAGTGRRVDLETAAGRLALAESNLITETSNLHDVSARYQRIVGQKPPAEMPPPPVALFGKDMPKDHGEAISRSFQTSPQMKAAIENIMSAMRQEDVQKGRYQPRIDAYAEKSHETNLDGYRGPTNTTTVGLTATWNLYQGSQDISRARKAAEEKNMAKDMREKVCRDVRQNSSMTFNDQKRLTAQLPLLDQHQLSTDKAREAFRRQFEIGQRTLLDVLDTENEYYTARRNYLNGDIDLSIAQAKYLSVSGNLLKTLNMAHLEAMPFNTAPLADEALGPICPPEPVFMPVAKPEPKKGDYVVLLENPDGSTGKVIIAGTQGQQTIDQARQGAPLDASAPPTLVSDEDLQRDFGDAMAARPVLPEHFTLYFQNGKASLTAESQAIFPKVLEGIANHSIPELVIVGHTDTTGSAARNETLGLQRAKFVADSIRKLGIKVHSITPETRGERELLIPTPDKTVEPRNRRVNISIR
jgi:adhesin transport system outer membrane protein